MLLVVLNGMIIEWIYDYEFGMNRNEIYGIQYTFVLFLFVKWNKAKTSQTLKGIYIYSMV